MDATATRPRRRVAAAMLVVGLVVTACGSGVGSRPAALDWVETWRDTTANSPVPIDTVDELTDEACSTLLADARTERPDLLPTPDESLDGLVDQWINLAETIGFDCQRHPDVLDALDDLHGIEDEVDVRIEALRG